MAGGGAHGLVAQPVSYTHLDVYKRQPNTWTNLMKNAMSEDFSFARSAEDYARLYIDML